MSFNEIKYINWTKEAEHIHISEKEYNTILERLTNHGYLIDESKTKFLDWAKIGSYRIDKSKLPKYISIFVHEKSGFKVYVVDIPNSNRKVGIGRQSFKNIDKRLKNKYNKSFVQIYGVCTTEIKRNCLILPPLIRVIEKFRLRKITNCYMADISSAYPFAGCGGLPDAHTAEIIEGQIEPDAVYKYCFYSNGHVAEFRKCDSRQICKHVLYKNLIEADAPCEATIRMKESPIKLDDIFEELYYEKEYGDEETAINAKNTLVCFIGYLQSLVRNKIQFAGHIPAIIYVRHIARMCELYDNIIKNSGEICMISTDSFLWTAPHKIKVAKNTNEKKCLGDFIYKFENVNAYIKANGVYCIADHNGELLQIKHQGMPETELKKLNIKSLNDYMNISIYEKYIDPNTQEIKKIQTGEEI